MHMLPAPSVTPGVRYAEYSLLAVSSDYVFSPFRYCFSALLLLKNGMLIVLLLDRWPIRGSATAISLPVIPSLPGIHLIPLAIEGGGHVNGLDG